MLQHLPYRADINFHSITRLEEEVNINQSPCTDFSKTGQQRRLRWGGSQLGSSAVRIIHTSASEIRSLSRKNGRKNQTVPVLISSLFYIISDDNFSLVRTVIRILYLSASIADIKTKTYSKYESECVISDGFAFRWCSWLMVRLGIDYRNTQTHTHPLQIGSERTYEAKLGEAECWMMRQAFSPSDNTDFFVFASFSLFISFVPMFIAVFIRFTATSIK